MGCIDGTPWIGYSAQSSGLGASDCAQTPGGSHVMFGSPSPPLRIYSENSAPFDDQVVEPADRLFHREAFRKLPRKEVLEPFSRDWFERIAECRYSRQGYWLPRMLEFNKHPGERLLALGEGLGTDWVQYARAGADVSVLSSTQEQLELIRIHFDICNVAAHFLHGSLQALPVTSNSVDVVCLNGLLHEVDDPARIVGEIYRVLRPGGKVIGVAPAKFNATYWARAVFPWRHWFGLSKTQPVPAAQSASDLRKLFGDFAEHRLSKRHLRRGELPPICRWLPLPALERVIGNQLIIKAFKPLSAATSERKAAA
jgi:SAM-dependent methyltransferase